MFFWLYAQGQFTVSERGATAIISALPMPTQTFKLLRYSAIVCAYLIAVILSTAVCLVFYWHIFDYTAFGPLLWLDALLLLPSSVLLFGAAMLLGDRKAAAVLILLAAVLIVGVFQITLPPYIDLIGFSATLSLYSGEQDFVFTSAFLASRTAFFILGTVFIIISIRRVKRKA